MNQIQDFKSYLSSNIDPDEIIDIVKHQNSFMGFNVLFKNNKENKYYIVDFRTT